MATPKLASLELPGADGRPLYVDVRTGARRGEARPTVVVCHGFKGFKDWGFFPVLGERLAVAGFTAVSFNFSGSGVSPGSDVVDQPERWFDQTVSGDLSDLGTVVEWAVAGGAPWIALLGHSRGGGLAILGAARDTRVKALVTWSAVAGFLRYAPGELAQWRREGRIEVVNARTGQRLPIGLRLLEDLEANGAGDHDVLGAAAHIRVPWLLVHGTADETVPVDESESLVRASGSTRTERFLVEGGTHTLGAKHPWAGSTPPLEEAVQRTIRFLGAALG